MVCWTRINSTLRQRVGNRIPNFFLAILPQVYLVYPFFSVFIEIFFKSPLDISPNCYYYFICITNIKLYFWHQLNFLLSKWTLKYLFSYISCSLHRTKILILSINFIYLDCSSAKVSIQLADNQESSWSFYSRKDFRLFRGKVKELRNNHFLFYYSEHLSICDKRILCQIQTISLLLF